MTFIHNIPVLLIFIPMLAAVICLLPFRGEKAKWLTLGCFALLTVLAALLVAGTLGGGSSFAYTMGRFPAPYGNELRVGPLEALMALMVSTISLLIIAAGSDDIFGDIPIRKTKSYFLLQNVLTASMMALLFANDFFTAYVFVELITISAVALVASKPEGRTWAAALNYLFMGLVGSSILTFSLAMLYGITGHLHFEYIHRSILELVATQTYMVPLSLASVLMVIGLAIKSALFPFHNWLPEAHGSATTTASAILSGLILKSYLLLLVKMVVRVFGLETMASLAVPQILLAFGAAAIAYGSWKAMHQRGLKRALAYSSISQVGYICIALGLNTEWGIAAACFHIIIHAVAKAMLFSSAGALKAASNHRQDIDSLEGAYWRDPVAGTAFIVGSLALIGIPPLSGFASKLNIILASLHTPYPIVAVVAIVLAGSIMGTMIYFPFIFSILRRDGIETEIRRGETGLSQRSLRSLTSRVALVVFMVLTVLLGLFSSPVIHALQQGLAVYGTR